MNDKTICLYRKLKRLELATRHLKTKHADLGGCQDQ